MKAILIQKAKDEQDAIMNFGYAFGLVYMIKANVYKGVHIDPDFQELITERARKLILKLSSDTPDTPSLFSYTNSIYLEYRDSLCDL